MNKGLGMYITKIEVPSDNEGGGGRGCGHDTFQSIRIGLKIGTETNFCM